MNLFFAKRITVNGELFVRSKRLYDEILARVKKGEPEEIRTTEPEFRDDLSDFIR